ncbi:MAG: hypothetical protein ACI8S6_001582 [Myxococcota bacterium]|jgi:hypothetical protein
MGSHTPKQPTDTLAFLADWQDDAPPTALEVVLDGRATALQLAYGTDKQGVYTADVSWDGGECAAYFFRWTDALGGEGTFPGEGSYLIGAGCDEPLMWEDSQHRGSLLTEPWDDDDDDEGRGGCSAAVGPMLLGALLGFVSLAGRRRRAGSGEDWGVQRSQSRGETL